METMGNHSKPLVTKEITKLLVQHPLSSQFQPLANQLGVLSMFPRGGHQPVSGPVWLRLYLALITSFYFKKHHDGNTQ